MTSDSVNWPFVLALTRSHESQVRVGCAFQRRLDALVRPVHDLARLERLKKGMDDLDRGFSLLAARELAHLPAYQWGISVRGVWVFTLPGIMAEIGAARQARVRFPPELVPNWDEERWVTHPARLPKPLEPRDEVLHWVAHGHDEHRYRRQQRHLRALRVAQWYPELAQVEVLEERQAIACFPSVSSLYVYSGHHVVIDPVDRCVRSPMRFKFGELHNWSSRLRGLVISLGVGLKVKGEYFRKVYLRELARQRKKPIEEAHADARARRYAAKLYLRMLWQVWREADGFEVPSDRRLNVSVASEKTTK